MKPKKDLKKYINENGFWLQFDKVERLDTNIARNTHAQLPQGDNILVFKGKLSQTFGKGEVSRNEYKIDPKGWQLDNYLENPIVLLSHNPEDPIGKTIEINRTDDGLDILYYIDLSWIDEVNANRIRGGTYDGLSTGHITHEYKFENKSTGELLSTEEVKEKHGLGEWDLLFSDAWNYVVTKAELLESSVVTLPSNPKALTVQNSLKYFFENKMKENENLETEEKVEVPAEIDAEPKEAENDAQDINPAENITSLLQNEVKTLKDEIAELKKNAPVAKESEALRIAQSSAELALKNATRLNEIFAVLRNIPQSKSLILTRQFAEEKKDSTPIYNAIKSAISE